MSRNIGIYELKTHISKVLREVARGQRYTITHRGKPMGELAPPGEVPAALTDAESWQEFWRIVEELRASPSVDDRPLQDLLDEIRG